MFEQNDAARGAVVEAFRGGRQPRRGRFIGRFSCTTGRACRPTRSRRSPGLARRSRVWRRRGRTNCCACSMRCSRKFSMDNPGAKSLTRRLSAKRPWQPRPANRKASMRWEGAIFPASVWRRTWPRGSSGRYRRRATKRMETRLELLGVIYEKGVGWCLQNLAESGEMVTRWAQEKLATTSRSTDLGSVLS